MKRILKAEFFELRSEKLLFIVWFFILGVFCALSIIMGKPFSKDSIATVSIFWGGQAGNAYMFNVIFTMVATVMILGRDFDNLTIRYQLMSGVTRRTVYRARVIEIAIVVTVSTFAFMLLAPFTFIVNGIGGSLSFWQYFLRVALYNFVMLREAAVLILIVVICKKKQRAYVAATLLYFIENSLDGIVAESPGGNKAGSLIFINATNDFFEMKCWSIMTKAGEIVVFDPSFPAHTFRSIIVTVVMIILFLVLGEACFNEDEI